MIFTNVSDHGGNFDQLVSEKIQDCDNVTIASGYVSLDIIEKYAPQLERVASNGGRARLLIGMAFYEGLSQRKLTRLLSLSTSLSRLNEASGVFITYERRYHGKIYVFDKDGAQSIYVGSSNFSLSGLKGNMEATAPILDGPTKRSVALYIDYLFKTSVSKKIDELDIIVPGSNAYRQRISNDSLDQLEHFNPESINTEHLEYFDYDLERVVDKQKSSLNVYFGEGRINRVTGKIAPRPWYEVALIAPVDSIRNPIYPRGNFDAYTDDGIVIPMSANGQNNKNIQSRGSLKLFGMWLKGRLQKSGALLPLTPITIDTLEAYGRSTIRFYKIADRKYYVDFASTAEVNGLTALNEDGETN